MSRKKIKISKSDYPFIEKLASQGLSVTLIADYLGISKATLDRRISECEELSIILNKGRSKGIEAVASAAYQMAISGKSAIMTIFWLRCQAGWKEKNNELDSDESMPIRINFVRASRKEKE